MSYNIFIISDTHFSHENMYQFFNYDGTKLRPWDSAEDADDFMIEKWNSIVKPNDKVYHLGDVGINRNKLDIIMQKLNGTKVLIKGNHDKFKPKFYLQHFKDIRGCHNLDNFLLTHIPVHPECKSKFKLNIHGHVHANSLTDPWYYNTCVEVNNYAPIPFEEIKQTTQQ